MLFKRMEVAQKNSWNFLSGILDTIADPVFVKGRQHHWVFLNDAFCKFIGHPLVELLGKSDYDFFPKYQADVFWEKDEAVFNSGLENINEEDFTGADGITHTILTKKTCYTAADGQQFLVGVISDITERKRAEKLLSRYEQEFRTLAENSPDTIVRYDRDCRFVYANPLFEKLRGVAMGELCGKTPMQIPGLPYAELYQQRVQAAIETGAADEFELAIVNSDGTTDWRMSSIVPEFDAQGHVAYVQVVSRNINSLKEVELQLKESRARLRQLFEYQEDAHEHERKKISWDMHEELLQILSAVHMYAKMLQSSSGELPERFVQTLPSILSGMNQSILLVREMVTSLRPTVLNLGILAALEWLEDEFACQHPGQVCKLEADEEVAQMDEKSSLVVFRIVQEALAFTAKYKMSGKVNVSLACDESGYLLVVRDKSKGNNVDLSDSNFLGLYGLQERVLAMGGEMLVFSAPDHGLIVEARLPAQEAG